MNQISRAIQLLRSRKFEGNGEKNVVIEEIRV